MNENANRLIKETSPYLLQHAYNPVDWFPWGEEAFEKATRENRLIFLSIGYSTCHWCHEMAHDAFSHEETAKYLNENFVSIKVDREERPDLDEIYMLACQLLSENCGWPLNLFITTDKKPIFATTYLPSVEKFSRPSFLGILKEVNNLWKTDPNKIFTIANAVSSRIEALQGVQQDDSANQEINMDTLVKTFNIFAKSFDKDYGGFGAAPKFPSPHNLSFLLEWYKNSNEQFALEMVEKTLNSMYKGGIFDHVGGGFHRYSVDGKWLIPHFEKTLYDQALIANTYIEAYQITQNGLYADVAKKTLDFVLNELTNEEGAFYCGLDADTEGEEGKFYVWTKDEILNILESDAKLFCDFYGVTESGNFESGKNILFIPDNTKNLFENYELGTDEIMQKLDSCLETLFDVRKHRTKPHVDDKIIASWNGLMIKSLALGAKVFYDERYKKAAIKASNFIVENLITPDGHVLRSYREGKAKIDGFLEDYAFLNYGFLELFKSTQDSEFLIIAEKLTRQMILDFYDEVNGGFFSTSINSEIPLIRIKSPIDNAIPSGNSIAVLTLLMLADITKNSQYLELAKKTFNCFGYKVDQYPAAYTQLLTAFLHLPG